MTAPRAAALAALACLAARAAAAGPSPLAVPVLASAGAPALLAQRAIERRWGASEDTLYTVVELPGWRGEGFALAASAAVPGAGQAYAGDRFAAAAFVAAEAAGWILHLFWRDRGETLRAESESYAGAPQDPASAWSFDRWTSATNADPAELQALYTADPRSFYDLIGSDARYLAGWAGGPVARQAFATLRDHAQARFRNARYAAIGLWLNHVTSAAPPQRAAPHHNQPRQRDLELKLKSGWRDGPTVYAMLERRF